MKHMKKFTAILLALVIGFSVCSMNFTSAAEETAEPANLIEYKEMLDKEGYPALSTKQFYRIVTGGGMFSPKSLKFTTDDILQQLCAELADETGFDIILIANSIPKTNQLVDFATTTFNIDTSALSNIFFNLQHEFDAKGQYIPAGLMYYIGLYLKIIDECKAYCAPREGWSEDWYEIHLQITLRDGTTEDIGAGIMINPETGEVRGVDDNGMMGIGYNFSFHEALVYAPVNVWMRDFGFTLAYDLFCYSTPFFFYNTRRIKFDYEGKEWMIQIWKGNYLVSNGAEVGIYNRDAKKFGTYYDCVGDEDMMNMSMKLYHGDELIFERPEQTHWWLTGFKLSDTLYPAETMTLDFTIEMKDEAMLKAFCNAIDKHYRQDMTYTVDGLKVNVIW